MNTNSLEKQFKKIGAGVTISQNEGRNTMSDDEFSVDFRNNSFIIAAGMDVEVEVVDVDKADKHLLLNITQPAGRRGTSKRKHKILCGHDERDYFVAAVPETFTWVKNVAEAKGALKPGTVHNVESSVKASKRNKRKLKNKRVRQGEWFFVKADNINPDPLLIHKNEPITRGRGSKPHMVDEVYRTGGTAVRVCSEFPTGITEGEYVKLIKKSPEKANLNWRFMTRDAAVYARGRVRHADHATITLDGWHLVIMNTENLSSAGRNIAFLD